VLTTHDDVPHPVPPIAYLRYKENWFFIIIDVSRNVYGMAHFNYEPGFDRARVSCNLMVRGETFKYGSQIAFPADFAMSPQIGDDRLKVRFVEAHTRFDMQLNSGDVELDISFLKHAPTFDYGAYDAANPEKPSYQEVMTFATHQMFHHQQQALTMSGTLKMKAGKARGETIHLKGLGCRDHSRCIRVDNMTLRHVWSILYFPKTVFGVMSLASVLRPETTATSGYVWDSSGTRSLKDIEIRRDGELSGDAPAMMEFKLNDVYGKPFTVIADITNRMGYVPLVAEAAGSTGHSYSITENFCPVSLKETGETGYALIETGFNAKATEP
jgi:hypothetical protein